MVKYEVIFTDLPNPEASYAKCIESNDLKALNMMGIGTQYKLEDFEGKKVLKMYCSFALFIPESIAKTGMEKVATTLEQQNNCKVTYRQL